MTTIELPHTRGCVVCGPGNPHGLHLRFEVDPADGTVRTAFTPQAEHIGFENIIHGGILSTVLDEALVWAAIWRSRRACVAGELNVRFRKKAAIGTPLRIVARVVRSKSRVVEVEAEMTSDAGELVAGGSGKYLTLSESETTAFVRTFIEDAKTAEAAEYLGGVLPS